MKSAQQRFWTLGAGKGGVGKSLLTASMGVVLARMGKSVVAVDADLGSANLHTFAGIKTPRRTLQDFFENRASVDEIVIETSQPGFRFISCAGDDPGAVDPTEEHREKIIRFILGLHADHVLVDLGAGTSLNVLDIFNISNEGIVVASPDPASIQKAYAFIKKAIYRRIQKSFGSNEAVARALRQLRTGVGSSGPRTMMDFYELLCTTDPEIAESISSLVDDYRPLIVINMAHAEQEQRVAEIIQSACRRFLNVDIRFCGLIVADPLVRRTTQQMKFLNFDNEESIAAGQIRMIVQRMLSSSKEPAIPESPAPATPIMGLNDDLEFMGRKLHVQTEDRGYTGRCIITQVFCKGQVLLSAKSEYPATICETNGCMQVSELMRKQHFNVIRQIESKNAPIHLPA